MVTASKHAVRISPVRVARHPALPSKDPASRRPPKLHRRHPCRWACPALASSCTPPRLQNAARPCGRPGTKLSVSMHLADHPALHSPAFQKPAACESVNRERHPLANREPSPCVGLDVSWKDYGATQFCLGKDEWLQGNHQGLLRWMSIYGLSRVELSQLSRSASLMSSPAEHTAICQPCPEW